jgi:hypothetical protein
MLCLLSWGFIAAASREVVLHESTVYAMCKLVLLTRLKMVSLADTFFEIALIQIKCSAKRPLELQTKG